MAKSIISNKYLFLLLICLISFPQLCTAGDVFYYVSLDQLKIIDGSFPAYDMSEQTSFTGSYWRQLTQLKNYKLPYAIGDNHEEIYIYSPFTDESREWRRLTQLYGNIISSGFIAIRSSSGKIPSGTLYVASADLTESVSLRFRVPKTAKDKTDGQAKQEKNFYNAKAEHFDKLHRMNIPGAAFFRNMANSARKRMGTLSKEEPQQTAERPPLHRRQTELQRTYGIFTAGRALSENLQLDRQLPILPPKKGAVALNSIKGITTTPMDWKQETRGMKPKKDLLARYIPFDQYAVFFPTYKAMRQLADEIDARGTPILQAMEPRAEDAGTRKAYETQLCLPSTELSRILGPHLIKRLAFTGSDPFLRTGSDMAVLFEAKDIRLLENVLKIRLAAASKTPGVKKVKGMEGGINYSGVKSADRRICAYLAKLEKNILVVTNSLFQLKQLAKTVSGKTPPLYSLDEYTFFRNRYPLNTPQENAFIMLSDGAIRKWCSPRWRIGDSRRTRATAIMADLQAEYLEALTKGKIPAQGLAVKGKTKGLGAVKVTRTGVTSEIYGSLHFLTPIGELPMDKVSKEEAEAYNWFRKNYQNRWRRYFDPIAIRFITSQNKLEMDISIRPLIADSKYGSLMELASNNAIGPTSGDPHKESLIHYILSLDPEARPVKEVGNIASRMAPQLGTNAFNWIGQWVSIYVDQDPLWQELEKISKSGGDKAVEKYMEKNFRRFPLALVVEVKNSLNLTLFLTALRAFIQQTSPGMTTWTTEEYQGLSYVKIGSKYGRRDDQTLEIYYAPTPSTFIVTLNKQLMIRYLRRQTTTGGKVKGTKKWIGKSMGLQVRGEFLKVIRMIYGVSMRESLMRQSWGNIMILNQWRRQFNQKSPLDFHQRFWHARLLCPGGGKYVWNEKFKTMESTVFGHPLNPKKGTILQDPLFEISNIIMGITFEANGLRARGRLSRVKK